MSLRTIVRPATYSSVFSASLQRPKRLVPATSVLRPRYQSSLPFSTSTISRAQAAIPTKMRAVLIKDGKGPVENLYLGEEATPEPKEGQVQVQVRTSPVISLERQSNAKLMNRSKYAFIAPYRYELANGAELWLEPNGYHAARGQIPLARTGKQDDHGCRILRNRQQARLGR